MTTKRKVLLIILDGLGAAPLSPGNAVVQANPTTLSSLWSSCPHTYLIASGQHVGLPANVKGNSEVGHLNIGAGRTVSQSLPRINNAIEKGLLFQNNTLIKAYNHASKFGGNVHLVGLVSDGDVHSNRGHFKAIIDFFSKQNFPNKVFIHAFTDGRDTSVNAAATFLADLDKYCMDRGIGQIGTLIGRFYGMDRNNKWDRTERAYYLLEKNVGEKFPNYYAAVEHNYKQKITDEFLEPSVINSSNIKENDSVILMNFRPDRMVQLAQALADDNFQGFIRKKINNLFVATMVDYKKDLTPNVIFPKQYINLTLGNIIDSEERSQLRIAETEKFPHVTYFFNGGTSVIYNKEDRIIIPSPRVTTYDQKPEMSAVEITTILLDRISKSIYDFIVVNFANTDMVGHTGNFQAAVKSVKVVDFCVKELVNHFTSTGGIVFITSDHGNVEEMLNPENGQMDTEHSINPVPLIIAGTPHRTQLLPYGALRDIAPTILQEMGISKPSEMTGKSLLPLS